MNWQTITLEQYQQVYRIMRHEAYEDFEKEIQICALLADKTESDVEAMTLQEYKELKQGLDFVFRELPKEGRRITKWKGFAFIYDVRQLTAGRYVSLQYFLKLDLIENLHNLAACLVVPQDGYDAKQHEDYANKLLQCPFLALYHYAVFFCNLYNLTISNLQPYLENELLKMAKEKNLTPEQVKAALIPLSKPLVGY